MTRIAAPALIVMLTVAGFVGAAAWNASGEPLLVITLTERELELPARSVPHGDDPGLQLRINYQGRYDPLDSRNWLSESRLVDLGFSLHVPAGSPDAVHVYDHVPARLAWVALEYDGPAWRDIERRRLLRESESGPERGPHLRSRLVPVDAAADFETLKARYPSGHLIVRGVIRVAYLPAENGGPLVYGVLREIVPQHVAVPYAMKPLFVAPAQAQLRYEAELSLGRLGLPFLRSVRLAG